MKRHNWFLASTIALLIVLLGSASCITAASTREAAPNPNAGNISTTATEETYSGSASATATPNNTTIGNDPVSGQNKEVDLLWEQLCQSSEYQVQIAKDRGFTVIVLDTGPFAPASAESPGAYYPAGGWAASPSSLTAWGNLEAGHTYYWRARVRQAATGQYMLSPWSEVQSFTVESGAPVSTASYGLQPIYPNNGQVACPIKSASFSWSPMADTTKYRFVLAKDAAMTQVVIEDITDTTAYSYQGQLEYDQAYFWRVMALEPVPGDWSATFSFRTESAPLPVLSAPHSPLPPAWAWAIITIGLILLVVVIVLIFRMRRR